jgi:hypothetical protein
MKKFFSKMSETGAWLTYFACAMLFNSAGDFFGVGLCVVGVTFSLTLFASKVIHKDNRKFLEENPLCFSFKKELALKVREILKEANTHYVVEYREEETSSYINFYIHIPTRGFADGYSYISRQLAPLRLETCPTKKTKDQL